MQAKLVSVTQPIVEGINTPQELIVYCARVSSPNNQLNTETAPRLLAYLIRKKHWSPFEMVDMCVEVTTSRAIAAQLLRHRSFSFQEFSLRYATSSLEFEHQPCRMSGASNRQGSVPATHNQQATWYARLGKVQDTASKEYAAAIQDGVAPEVARMLLPLGLSTRLYVKGSVRDWIHYLDTRTSTDTQQEHREMALAIKDIFDAQFPSIAVALADRELK